MLETQTPNPYPHKFKVTHTHSQFKEQFEPLTKPSELLDDVVSIAGRLTAIRTSGKKLYFYDIKGEGMTIQVFASASNYKGTMNFHKIHRMIKRGDIIGVRGHPTRTKAGELSIAPGDVQLLSPCLIMMPGHGGLKQKETRYRQRYLDLIVNNSTRDIFMKRA